MPLSRSCPRDSWGSYFFSPAAQFSTTVNGAGRLAFAEVTIGRGAVSGEPARADRAWPTTLPPSQLARLRAQVREPRRAPASRAREPHWAPATEAREPHWAPA